MALDSLASRDAGYWLNRYIARYGIRKFPA
ncbi:DUF905 family protein [Leclercia sp.]|nr:DUF905 family protein [Leclercia sp.]